MPRRRKIRESTYSYKNASIFAPCVKSLLNERRIIRENFFDEASCFPDIVSEWRLSVPSAANRAGHLKKIAEPDAPAVATPMSGALPHRRAKLLCKPAWTEIGKPAGATRRKNARLWKGKHVGARR
jgi:hypothetical protein